MDFNVEEYRKKQEVKKLKERRLKRKKTRNQLIGFFLILSFLSYILSVTEIGCDFLQDYFIDSAIDPYIEQAKKMDNFQPQFGIKYYPEYSENFKNLMKQNFADSWLIGLQKYIASKHYFWSREYKAYKTYHKYRIYFGYFLPEKEVIETFSIEITTSKDSAQFKDSGELMEQFFDTYESKRHIAEPWYSKVVKVHQNWTLLGGSKKQMNEFVR